MGDVTELQLLDRCLFGSRYSDICMDRSARIPECPRCGNPIDIDTWMLSLDMETGAAALDAGKVVSLSGDCSACAVPLELFIERTSPHDKIGVDVWVEDRRDE